MKPLNPPALWRRNHPLTDWAAVTRAARKTAAEYVSLKERQNAAAARAYDMAGLKNPDLVLPDRKADGLRRRLEKEQRAADAGVPSAPAFMGLAPSKHAPNEELIDPSNATTHFTQWPNEAGTQFPVLRRYGVHSPQDLYAAPGKPADEKPPASGYLEKGVSVGKAAPQGEVRSPVALGRFVKVMS